MGAVVLDQADFGRRTVDELEFENHVLKEMAKRKIKQKPMKPKLDLDEELEWSPIKKDGVKKPSAAETIPNYDTFMRITNYFLERPRKCEWQRYRDYALFWCGVGFGLRFSDIVRLKPKHVWDEDGNYRERLQVIEKKTQKFQQCVITEAVRKALDLYAAQTNGDCKRWKYLFPSLKNNGQTPMTTANGWEIFSSAQKELGLTFHLSTHSMRHTCLNICLCADETLIDPMLLMKLQLMANHTNMGTTMAYLDKLWGLTDQARAVVSDWMLGRSDKKELIFMGVRK